MGRGTTYVGFLRAVNVAGRTVAMTDLRRTVADAGFSEVRTLLNSGNLVFESEEGDAGRVERRLEAACGPALGLALEFLVRDRTALAAVRAANPFAAFARADPSHLLLVFLKDAPARGVVDGFVAGLPGPEEARVVGTTAYVTYPEGIGRSPLTLPRIEKALGTRGTGRNWNTVGRLAELAAGPARSREGG